PNTPAQHAAAVALTMPQDCVEEMRQAFEQRRDELCEGINSIDGLSCRVPEGAFYVMVNVSGCVGRLCQGTPIADSDDFANRLLDMAHVATVPGGAFMAEGYVRVSYATSIENIREGLRRIEAFVAALQ
ncbi:MAG: aminotransferase class I/II-fold pyridoxal phosphate-dependent enzyme, partial [Eubacteriales bacterium]|nr:aminotransferase class I/II-fold pyridoxal phosphate-dependent enzyme [Eubacteriales bacterium]